MSNKQPIELSPPHFDTAFNEKMLLGLPSAIVSGFEDEVKRYVGRPYAVALHSGTSAIHLALKVLEIGRGDVVLCQSLTYVATAFPILYEGAQPVFIDSEPGTGNMDPELLEQAIEELLAKGQKPAALIFVHLYGIPAKADKILSIAAKHNIPVIEDAAEALGAEYHKTRCGNFGTVSILSFNSNKVITSGGGGMLLTDDKELAGKALYFAKQAKDEGAVMNHREVGYNYRMNHVNAALGSSQFTRLEERIRKRREIFEFYKESLGSIPGASFLREQPQTCSSRWLTTLFIDPTVTGGITRTRIQQALDIENIESRPLWKPMHLQPVFKDAPAYVNGISEKLFTQGLCLPSGSNLSPHDLERISTVIKRVFS